jgi:hypothetical protein
MNMNRKSEHPCGLQPDFTLKMPTQCLYTDCQLFATNLTYFRIRVVALSSFTAATSLTCFIFRFLKRPLLFSD